MAISHRGPDLVVALFAPHSKEPFQRHWILPSSVSKAIYTVLFWIPPSTTVLMGGYLGGLQPYDSFGDALQRRMPCRKSFSGCLFCWFEPCYAHSVFFFYCLFLLTAPLTVPRSSTVTRSPRNNLWHELSSSFQDFQLFEKNAGFFSVISSKIGWCNDYS